MLAILAIPCRSRLFLPTMFPLTIRPGSYANRTGRDSAPLRATRIDPHPITDAVRAWQSLDLPANSAVPPAGWQALLSAGDRVLVAVHDAGAVRQLWTCIDPAGWADRPEFVAFWT